MEIITLKDNRGTIIADEIRKTVDNSIYLISIGNNMIPMGSELIAHCSADKEASK